MADETKPPTSAPPGAARRASPTHPAHLLHPVHLSHRAHPLHPVHPSHPAHRSHSLSHQNPRLRRSTSPGKTTTAAATAAKVSSRDPDDSSPLVTRRIWLGMAWGAFSAASAAALAATGRFMFPNVLNEPPQQFKVGLPGGFRYRRRRALQGVERRVDRAHATTTSSHRASGFYVLNTTCTHLGCTPNFLAAEAKFKCPCHGSGFRPTGINFEGPAPRPLERDRIVLAEDGQILIDKSRKFQYELGQWIDPDAFLQI